LASRRRLRRSRDLPVVRGRFANRAQEIDPGPRVHSPARSVFINCPFDPEYISHFDALVFTIVCCGFNPRSALETRPSEPPKVAEKKDDGVCARGMTASSRTVRMGSPASGRPIANRSPSAYANAMAAASSRQVDAKPPSDAGRSAPMSAYTSPPMPTPASATAITTTRMVGVPGHAWLVRHRARLMTHRSLNGGMCPPARAAASRRSRAVACLAAVRG
jgi:hypothetical protein